MRGGIKWPGRCRFEGAERFGKQLELERASYSGIDMRIRLLLTIKVYCSKMHWYPLPVALIQLEKY